MKNTFSANDLHRMTHEELQRLACAETGRSLSGAELHALQEQLRQNAHATDALDSLTQYLQRNIL